MWRENDEPRRRSRRSNKTIITMIRTPTWSCRRRFPSSKTTSTRRVTRERGGSLVELTITASSTARRSCSCSKRIDKWIPMDPIMQQLKRRPRNCPNAISAPSVDFHPITRALHVAQDSAASNASRHIKTPAASSSLTKRRVIDSRVIINTTWRWRRVESEKRLISLPPCVINFYSSCFRFCRLLFCTVN